MTAPQIFIPLLDLYHLMDAAFDRVARAWEFQCRGCTDNCCRSLFFHHTYIETDFLRHGFQQLPETEQTRILQAASDYIRQTEADPASRTSPKPMCPLNREERCLLYPYRPMICRLHGIPHEVHPEGRPVIEGPGCHAGNFVSRPAALPFDRTPFYREMAAVEQTYRNLTQQQGKLRLTIARMLTGA